MNLETPIKHVRKLAWVVCTMYNPNDLVRLQSTAALTSGSFDVELGEDSIGVELIGASSL